MKAPNANAADAQTVNESGPAEQNEEADRKLNYWLDIALEDTFPCSDPLSSMQAV